MWEHLMFPSADKLYGDTDFFFQQGFEPAYCAKTAFWIKLQEK